MASTFFAGVLLVSLAMPSAFEGYESSSPPWGKLLWRGWSEGARQAVAGRIPAELAAVEGALGRRLGQSFTAALVPDGAELSRLVKELTGETVPPWRTRGVAIPAHDLLLIRGDPLEPDSGLQATLRHELAHLVLHRRGAGPIPRWADEGIACWVSGARLGLDDEARMSFLARLGGLYAWSSLEREMPAGEDPSAIAYAQSSLFVRFLAERWGNAAIPALLDRLDAGSSMLAALEATTRRSPAALQEELRVWVSSRASLIAALGQAGVGLWTLAGVLALLAVLRYVRRKRRYYLAESSPPETPAPDFDPATPS